MINSNIFIRYSPGSDLEYVNYTLAALVVRNVDIRLVQSKYI